MYGDVNVRVEDGAGTVDTYDSGVGVQVKIGASDVENAEPILITGKMKSSQVKELLGDTPLADACNIAIEWGAGKIYAVPVKASIRGQVAAVTHTGTGSGTVAFSGEPNNAYEIVVKIVEPGNTNEGTYRYSIDGGTSWSLEETIPLSGELELGRTGLKAVFTDAAEASEKSFAAGDTYKTVTTAPGIEHVAVLDAVETAIKSNLSFEFIHVVGASGKALWSALGTLAEEAMTVYKKPVMFLCEARAAQLGETAEQWREALETERKGVNSIYLQVAAGMYLYKDAEERETIINPAGILSGLYCRAKESQSIGEVKSFPVSAEKIIKILPEGATEEVEALDAAGYTTLRQYLGKENYYVTSANTFAPSGSNYPYAEDLRVMMRLVKEVRNKTLEQLQREVDPESLEADLAAIQAEINIPLEEAVADKIISSGEVKINAEGAEVLETESLDVSISYTGKRHIREYNIVFSVSNPYAVG